MGRLSFAVPGTPQPKGSRQALPMGGKAGSRRIVLVEAGTRVTRPAKALWYRRVGDYASRARKRPLEPICEAVAVEILFRLPIAASRRRGKRRLVPGDPHTQKPDIDKLARGCLDPLKVAGVLADDCFVSALDATKEWCEAGMQGADITLTW